MAARQDNLTFLVDSLVRDVYAIHMSAVEYKNVTVQMEQALLDHLDARANAMDLNRSQYLRRLIRRELGIAHPDLVPALNGHAEKAEVPA